MKNRLGRISPQEKDMLCSVQSFVPIVEEEEEEEKEPPPPTHTHTHKE